MRKGLDERNDESVHDERRERDRIANKIFVVECVGSSSVGRPRKRGINTVKECLRKRCFMSGKEGEWSTIGVNGRDLCRGMHGA